jgi:His/Glu/Gln/Arg/opine family amino acid ABC transporter permease subunit
MDFDFSVIRSNAGLLIDGLYMTLLITVISAVIGMLFGLVVCFGRLRDRGVAYHAARSYITFFRTTPELALIFWAYFCLPAVLDIRFSGLASGIAALALVCAAYMAEIYRAGIEAVPRGQIEAAHALGLPALAIWIKVLLPQALRRMTPALLNYLTELMKNSTLLAGIGVAELAYQAYTLGAETYRYMEFLSSIAVLFFLVIFPLSMTARITEARLTQRAGR